MESIFGYLINHLDIIVSIITLLLTFNRFYTFITSKPIERQLFTKEKKLLYDFVLFTTVLIIVPTLTFLAFFTEKKILSVLIFLLGYLLLSFILFGSIILIKKFISSKKHVKWYSYLKIIVSNPRLDIILSLIFYFNAVILFGTINALLIREPLEIKIKILFFLIIIVFEITTIYLVFVWGTNVKITKPILVSIRMEDGILYDKYYIYNPSGKNFLLIGKNKDSELCKEPILINIDKIIYCKEVNSILID